MDSNGSAGAIPIAEDKLRYETARKELILSLQKKRAVDRQLAQLEVQIYNFEGSYLSETAQHSGGNIIQGFDGYLKTQNVGRRRHEITDADRVFSNSSMTYQKSLELLGDADADADTMADGPLSSSGGTLSLLGGSRGPTPGLTTVVLPPPSARSQQELSAAQQKKARDKEYQRRKRASAARDRSQARAVAGDDDSESFAAGSSRRPSKKPRTADDD
ncbi:histone acetyltransferase subunit NuA4-domain-containing protein [Phellopilus nigrolimitatus]|nr:histone acetyltransferase subunit NuA4-domain-containing protein [Phellopilus nigrolimitatus]